MQRCPICQTEVPTSRRYPRAVCPTCKSRAVSADGRALVFFNVSFSGGYAARYADTREEYPDHMCFIDGIPCWADEDYYGGIVVKVIDKKE